MSAHRLPGSPPAARPAALPASDEAGAAVVELALVLPLLLSLALLVAPLPLLLHARLVLGDTAAATVRFATSRSDQARTVPGTADVPAGALPSTAQVTAEAERVWHDPARPALVLPAALSGVAPVRWSADASCPSGGRRTVEVEAVVGLGPVAVLPVVPRSVVLTTTATSCEE